MIAKFGPVGLRLATSGRPAVSTYVQVVHRSTVVEVDLYTDETGDTEAENPVLTDSSGNLSFWAEAGAYDIIVNGARIPVEVLGAGSGGSATFTHRQASPSASWTIHHNLGSRYEPLVILDDEPDRPVETDVEYPDLDTVILIFPEPCTGWAYFN